IHSSDSEAELGLADGGQGDAKMFAEKDVPKADEGDIFRDSKSLIEKRLSTTNGDHIINGLDGGWVTGLIDHLQSGRGAVIHGATGLENELVVDFKAGFAQGATVALKTLVGPWGGLRTG